MVHEGGGGLHPGPAAHHVQVQHLVQEVVDGLVVVGGGPGLVVGPGREPGQPLNWGPAGGVQVIHHSGWNQLKRVRSLNAVFLQYINISRFPPGHSAQIGTKLAELSDKLFYVT